MDEEKKAQWEERLAAHAASGMTVIDWCRENGITKHTYYYWKKRICKPKVEEQQPDETTVFAELPVKLKACVNTAGKGLVIKWQGFELLLSEPGQIELAAQLIRKLTQL